MPLFISPEGIKYSSKVEYFRTIEPQGQRSVPHFLTYMRRKYDLTEKVKNNMQSREFHKKRYQEDLEYRSKKRKSSLERYYFKKSKNNGKINFNPVVVN